MLSVTLAAQGSDTEQSLTVRPNVAPYAFAATGTAALAPSSVAGATGRARYRAPSPSRTTRIVSSRMTRSRTSVWFFT